MELGLTLGGGDSASADVASSTPSNKSTDLALALGVNSGEGCRHRDQGPRSDSDRTVTTDYHRLRLDLVPLWPPHGIANTGSLEGGSSGAAEGLDVNLVPAVAAAEEASSPNSVASALQVDFRIFGGQQGERTTSSRASDDDENGHGKKKLRLSKEQAAFLEENFKEHNTLNPKQKQALAKQLNLRSRQVEVWFQNRRARTKLKQTEVDCEYMKRCWETLTEENKRLHKELQELRALKSSNPYHMQLPATTLTMCPSCERTTATTTSATSSAKVTATGSTVAPKRTTDPSSKAFPFPLSKPKFFPFSSYKNQPQKSAAS